MAEQLIGDELLLLARAFVVNPLGDKVFAGAALALNKDRGSFAGGDFLDEDHHLLHFFRFGDNVVIAGAAPDLSAQRFDLVAQAAGFERVLDGDGEFVEIEGLADEIVGAELERVFHVVELRIGGDHDDGARATVGLDVLQHLETADVGQAHVEQHQVRDFLVREANRRSAVGGFDDFVTPLLALLAQRPADELFVVHN